MNHPKLVCCLFALVGDAGSTATNRLPQEQSSSPQGPKANAFGATPLSEVMATLTTDFVPRVEQKLREHAAFVEKRGFRELSVCMYAFNGKIRTFNGNPMVRPCSLRALLPVRRPVHLAARHSMAGCGPGGCRPCFSTSGQKWRAS